MNEQQEKSYPVCISCGSQLTPDLHDARGWENICAESNIYLCPKCILNSQACRDALDLERQKNNEIIRRLADFKYLLDEMDAEDKPKG